MSKSTTPGGNIDYKLAQFDFDTPVEEWPEEDIQDLLDTVAELDCEFGHILRDIRSDDGAGDQS